MRSARHEVTWWVTPDQDFYVSSKVLTGLCALEAAGEVVLRVRARSPWRKTHHNPMYLSVRDLATGDTRRVVVDLHDRADWFHPDAQAFAEVYFKREFEPSALAVLPAEVADQVVPFGLNFACLSRRAGAALVSAAGRVCLRGAAREPIRRAASLVEVARLLKGLPAPDAFEAGADDARAATVLFQTRVWAPERDAISFSAINENRAALVRTLRSALGTRFVGGIMADNFARACCPDVMVEAGTHRAAYARLLRQSTAAVYTHGLHHSTAFKLPEYLAAGLCVVSEPFEHQLPRPLVPGVHYLPFTTPDECVRQCRWLLEHPTEAARMRAANRRYYREEVEPGAHVRRLLARTFDATGAGTGSGVH